MNYSSEDLIEICENAFVSQEKWKNRDSSIAQRQLGKCYALLKAGCEFKILNSGDLKTDDYTIWIEITFNGFRAFEGGNAETETFYLPTKKRLHESIDQDWY